MSSFNSEDLFASGPCTFEVGPRGQQWARKVDLGVSAPGIEVLGDHTTTVRVHGRLTAASAAALTTLGDALEAQVDSKGDLVDDTGRTWSGLTMIEVVYEGPHDVGRLWSVGYTALFAVL